MHTIKHGFSSSPDWLIVHFVSSFSFLRVGDQRRLLSFESVRQIEVVLRDYLSLFEAYKGAVCDTSLTKSFCLVQLSFTA